MLATSHQSRNKNQGRRYTYPIVHEKVKWDPSLDTYDGTMEDDSNHNTDTANETDPVPPFTTGPANTSSPIPETPKGTFLAQTFGVRKHNDTDPNMSSKVKDHGRKYKCPNCKLTVPKLSEVNAHYKLKHEPVSCDTCG